MRSKTLLLAAALVLTAAPALEAQTEITARGADIRIGGRLHGQFTTSSVDGANSQFAFRRARLNIDVSVGDFWSARVQPDFVGGTATLQDAWVRFNFDPAFRVSVGQFQRAFDIFEASSSTELSIIERDGRIGGYSNCAGVGGVCTLSRFAPKLEFAGRDQGVRVEAGSGRLRFLGTLTNGTGVNTADENSSKSFGGRLTYAATEKLKVGGGIALHDYDDAGETEYATGWSAELEYGDFAEEGLHLQAGVIGGENWKVTDSPTFMAWQAVATWYAPLNGDRIVGIEPVARIGSGDPNTAVDDDGGLAFTPGLMFYVSGRNKFGFNVDFYSPQTGDTEYSFKFQTYVYF